MVPGFKAKEIKPTKTVGQRLRQARLKKEMSLERAEQLTKVKLRYLEALEEDRHDLLPTEVYTLGFLRCYGEALELNTAKLIDQYRHERLAVSNAKNQAPTVLAPARRLSGPRFLLTPRTVVTFGSALLVTALILYIVSGVRSFLAPPTLRLNEPSPDSRVENNTVKVAGHTDPAVSLTINGELVPVESSGSFSREIVVIPGLNTIEVAAVNRIGKEAHISRKILAEYSPASPSPAPESAVVVSPSPTPNQAAKRPVSPSPSKPTPLPSDTAPVATTVPITPEGNSP